MTRPERVLLEATDLEGNRYRRDAAGLKARAIQHEIDHLDGILFLDHLSLIRRQMLLARWRREHKDDTGYTKEVEPESASTGLMRIVFFGTPEFAVAVAPRSAPGTLHRSRRGHPARQAAGPLPFHARPSAGQEPPLSKPASRCSSRRKPVGDLFLAGLRRLEADLGVVVAYGHILRPEVLDAPARGMINVHASLLPRFRGAAPIQHAMLAGDRETGISIMQMEEGLDSGPVLHRVATPIGAGETAGALTPNGWPSLARRRWWRRSRSCSAGSITPQPQDESRATYAPKIVAGDGAPRLEPGRRPCSSARSGPSIRCRAPGRRSMGRR